MSFSSLRLSAFALLAASLVQAQQAPVGRIQGVVIDAEGRKPLADAGIQIVGTTLGAMSRADGSFSIGNVPAGTVTIQVRRLGYQPKSLTGIFLNAGAVWQDTIALPPANARLAALTVTAAADRGSVESALDEQRNANGVVSSVTAEQMTKSPDANAAQAVQRVSGVTVSDGKYVEIRGSGQRYTTTSLNGARIPSPEPERKVVPFDLFPSGLLQSVTTQKTFTPDLPGDFSGGSVDIRTREYPITRQLTYGATIGYAEGTLGSGSLPFAPGVGGERLAWAGSAREMPAVVRAHGDLSSVTQADRNQMINSFRNVWHSGSRSGLPTGSLRTSIGGNDRIAGRRIGYLLSGTYSYAQDLREDESRAIARPTGPTTQQEINRFAGSTSGESVLWGTLLNAGTLLSPSSRLTFNAMYNRTADNEARTERGSFEDLAIPAEITVLDYVQRSVWSTQLSGEHDNGRRRFEWAVSGAGVTREQPDRSELVQEIVPATATQPERLLWLNNIGEGAVRTFSSLDEKSGEAKASYRFDVDAGSRLLRFKVGGLARGTVRDASTNAYGIFASVMEDSIRAKPPEVLFGGTYTAPGSSALNIRSLAQGGSYDALDLVYAGFAMAEIPLTPALQMIGGARLEYGDAEVKAISTIGDRRTSNKEFLDPLPALSLAYRPSDAHTLRASVSRTLARPEYREVASIQTRDVLGGVNVRGNPDLVRTLIDNADLRWEYYPRRGEVLSAAVFAKRFHDPIERVSAATSTNSAVTFVNAASADNYGVELEARKNLDALADVLAPWTFFSSLTLMHSQIHLGGRSGANTNANRAMVGQAPYVVNAGLTYTTASGAGSATLLYNRVGPRIVEAGELPLPDVKEQAADMLDFSLRVPAGGNLQARFDFKNILDASQEQLQGSVTREFYRMGRRLQVGFSVQR